MLIEKDNGEIMIDEDKAFEEWFERQIQYRSDEFNHCCNEMPSIKKYLKQAFEAGIVYQDDCLKNYSDYET